MSTQLINKLRFGWSKWQGANRQLIKYNDDEWTCQVCASRHPSEIPCFMFEAFEEEYIKICSKCQKIKTEENIIGYIILIKRVRILSPIDILDLLT